MTSSTKKRDPGTKISSCSCSPNIDTSPKLMAPPGHRSLQMVTSAESSTLQRMCSACNPNRLQTHRAGGDEPNPLANHTHQLCQCVQTMRHHVAMQHEEKRKTISRRSDASCHDCAPILDDLDVPRRRREAVENHHRANLASKCSKERLRTYCSAGKVQTNHGRSNATGN